jgi:hypothetical protein
MTEPQNGTWQSLFLRAVLEPLDSPELEQRLKEAEIAISQRFQEFRTNFWESEERQALQDALRDLNFLKSDKFEFSTGLHEPLSSGVQDDQQ